MEVYSIGFTKKSAQDLFAILRPSRIRRLLDVRLNNVSQLAGFAKKDGLRFFLGEVCGASYEHEPLLAPTQVNNIHTQDDLQGLSLDSSAV